MVLIIIIKKNYLKIYRKRNKKEMKMMPYKSSTQRKAAMKEKKEYKFYKIYIKRQNGRSPSLSVITLYIKIFKLSNKKADEQIRFFFCK